MILQSTLFGDEIESEIDESVDRADFNNLSTEERNQLALSCIGTCRMLAEKLAGPTPETVMECLKRRQLVEEMTSEAFFACVLAAHKYIPEGKQKFNTYAYSYIVTKLIGFFSDRIHIGQLMLTGFDFGETSCMDEEGRVPDDSPEHSPDEIQKIAEQEEADRRGQLTDDDLGKLRILVDKPANPKIWRRVVELIITEGLTVAQVAERLELSVKDVKLHIRNAKKAIESAQEHEHRHGPTLFSDYEI